MVLRDAIFGAEPGILAPMISYSWEVLYFLTCLSRTAVGETQASSPGAEALEELCGQWPQDLAGLYGPEPHGEGSQRGARNSAPPHDTPCHHPTTHPKGE